MVLASTRTPGGLLKLKQWRVVCVCVCLCVFVSVVYNCIHVRARAQQSGGMDWLGREDCTQILIFEVKRLRLIVQNTSRCRGVQEGPSLSKDESARRRSRDREIYRYLDLLPNRLSLGETCTAMSSFFQPPFGDPCSLDPAAVQQAMK